MADLLKQMQGGSMPPWEAYGWFDTPRVTYLHSLAGSGPVLIAGRNVRRVGLLLSSDSGSAMTVSPTTPVLNGGYYLSTSQPWLWLTHQEHAVLVQEDWYCTSSILPSITVIEVLLRAWPGGDPLG